MPHRCAQVQRQIAARAKLTIAPWDGYLKYYNLGTKVRFKIFVDSMQER